MVSIPGIVILVMGRYLMYGLVLVYILGIVIIILGMHFVFWVLGPERKLS